MPAPNAQLTTEPEMTRNFIKTLIDWEKHHIFEAKDPFQSIFAGWSDFLNSLESQEPMNVSFQSFKDSIDGELSRQVQRLDGDYPDAILQAASSTIDLPIVVLNYTTGVQKVIGELETASGIALLTDGTKLQVALSELVHTPGIDLRYLGSVESFFKKSRIEGIKQSPKFLEVAKSLKTQMDTIQPLLALVEMIKANKQARISPSEISSAIASALHIMELSGSKNGAEVPTILMMGTQSHGKSSALSRLLQANIAYSASGTATKRPVLYVTVNSAICEYMVYDQNDVTRVSRLEEVLSVLDNIMEGEPSIEPILVLIKMPGLGNRFLDLVGLIHNREGRYEKLSQLAAECSAKYFAEYVVHGNKYSCGVFVTKVGCEAAEITWGTLLGQVPDPEKKATIVAQKSWFLLTHGDELGALIAKGLFADCRNWRDVDGVLFGSVYEVIQSKNIKRCLIASAPMSSREFGKKFECDPSRALEEYRSLNKEKEREMLESLNRIARENENFDDNKEDREEFFKRTEVDPIILDLSLRCFSGVLDLGPKVQEEWRQHLYEAKKAVRRTRKEIASVKTQEVPHIISEYFRDFVSLQLSLFTGQEYMSKDINASFHLEEWTRFKACMKDIEMKEVPEVFPFVVDDPQVSQNLADLIDNELKGLVEPSCVGAARLAALSREVFVKTLIIQPHHLTKSDLDISIMNGVLVFNLIGVLKAHLNMSTEEAGLAISQYLATRVAGIMRQQASLVREFMKHKMNYSLIASQLEEDIGFVLDGFYHKTTYLRVSQMVDRIVAEEVGLMDPHGPMLDDIATMLNPMDLNQIHAFCRKLPGSPYAKLFSESTNRQVQRSSVDGMDKVVAAVKGTSRFQSPSEMARTVCQLLSMSSSADTFLLKDNLFVTTDEDVVDANYSLKRMFASRFLGVAKGLYRGINKYISEESSGTVLNVRPRILLTLLREYIVRKYDNSFDREEEDCDSVEDLEDESSPPSDVVSNEIRINEIIKEQYDPSAKLLQELEERHHEAAEAFSILQDIEDALKTFFSFLIDNKEEIARQLVALPQNISLGSMDE